MSARHRFGALAVPTANLLDKAFVLMAFQFELSMGSRVKSKIRAHREPQAAGFVAETRAPA